MCGTEQSNLQGWHYDERAPELAAALETWNRMNAQMEIAGHGTVRAGEAATTTTPTLWPWALSSPPAACSSTTGWSGALVRRWSETSPVMVQPPLDQHYIVMHLGGAKRVSRRRDGAPVSTIAEEGSLTLVPAGTAFTWRTSGPIAFAHVYVRPQQLDVARFAEGRSGGCEASLVERVGSNDVQLRLLFTRFLQAIEPATEPRTLLLDSLLESFLVRLAQSHASRGSGGDPRMVALAPHRLQRVLDFLEANLDQDVSLADLGGAAGTSQFHFSHAFHVAAGCSPYRYLLNRRIEFAKVLLLATSESLASVSSKCGFRSKRQFGVAFKRRVGVGPKHFQILRRPRRPASVSD
ncbi:MAG: AraC family transcriptional regulator [Pseudomonadota bacterium]|nr:AraC family transcriptional regulator [Pseudomonadota bacterium]